MMDKIDRVYIDGYGAPAILRGLTDESVILEDKHGVRMMSIASFLDRYEEMAS